MALAVRVILCLDVDNGRVVKGVNFENLRDAGDPVLIPKGVDTSVYAAARKRVAADRDQEGQPGQSGQKVQFDIGQAPQLSGMWEAYHDFALGLVDGQWKEDANLPPCS